MTPTVLVAVLGVQSTPYLHTHPPFPSRPPPATSRTRRASRLGLPPSCPTGPWRSLAAPSLVVLRRQRLQPCTLVGSVESAFSGCLGILVIEWAILPLAG